EPLRQSLEQFFGAGSRLPLAARREYKFLSPSTTQASEAREALDKALAETATLRLSSAAAAFTNLTVPNPQDAAAWYNLGLARAWLGENQVALAALERYVELETDETRAGDAWALGEVLRAAHGMEAQADYLTYSALYQIRDGRLLSGVINDWVN